MAAVDKSAAIYSSGLWADALAVNNGSKVNKSDVRESYVYCVGARDSGKSAVVSKYLRPKSDSRRGSDVVDFACARKQNAEGRTDIANVWEFPGRQALADALAIKDKSPGAVPTPSFFLPPKSINTAVVVVAVDLSKPVAAFESACAWLDTVEAALSEQYKLLQSRGSQLPTQLKARAARVAAAAGSGKASSDPMRHSGVQIVLVGTKYDLVRDLDTAVKGVLGRALRCLAHARGAHLVYSGGLEAVRSRGSAEAKAEDEGTGRKLRSLLTHAMFTGFDKKPPVDIFKGLARSGRHPEVLPESPLCVLHGTDSFADIRLPDGGVVTDGDAAVRAWQAELAKVFPVDAQGAQKPPGDSVDLQSLASDPGIDALVSQMNASVQEAISKDRALAEKQRLLAKKRAAAAQEGSAGRAKSGASAAKKAPSQKSAAAK